MKKYEKFLESNEITDVDKEIFNEYFLDDALLFLGRYKELKNVFDNFSGCTIYYGLFRFHSFGSSFYWTEIVTEYFKNYKNKLYCFGFDWVGRNYAKDLLNDTIYLIDSAIGKVLTLENVPIDMFLNEDLVEYRNETLNTEYFNKLISKDNPLMFQKCMGFKTPLFLGGKDEINNYELIDMEVYWEIDYQLYCKVNNLPEDTLINKIKLKD